MANRERRTVVVRDRKRDARTAGRQAAARLTRELKALEGEVAVLREAAGELLEAAAALVRRVLDEDAR